MSESFSTENSDSVLGGEFTWYPFFLRFCFSMKKYALFCPHFLKSIAALIRLLHIGKEFV